MNSFDRIPTVEEVQVDLDWALAEDNRDEAAALRHLLKAALCKATLAAEAKAHARKADAESKRTAPYYPAR